VARGMYVQPVSIQNRRWTKGDIFGAHFKDQEFHNKASNYHYEWAWKTVGTWTDNRAEGSPFTTFRYSSNPF
jgi:hypothetical protein